MPLHYGIMLSIALGIACAGAVSIGFELLTRRRASFRLLGVNGPALVPVMAFLIVCAPFIILRNTVRGRQIEGRPMGFVFAALFVAVGWSAASGSALSRLFTAILA